jgi:hypothetical protein
MPRFTCKGWDTNRLTRDHNASTSTLRSEERSPRQTNSGYTPRMAERPWHARWRLRFALASVAAGLVSAAARAGASDSAGLVALEWVAPDGCPDRAYVEREVDRLLGDVIAEGGPYLRARAEIRQEQSGLWHIELRTTGRQGPGYRTVAAESCVALADATALILALAIDPDRVAANRSTKTSPPRASSQPATADAPTASSSNAAPAVPPAPERSASRSPSPRAARFSVAALAVSDTGTLPTAAAGVAARVAVIPTALPFLRIELGAGLFLDEETTNPPARSATFSLRTFDAGGCVVTQAARLEVGACAHVELEWISAAGLYESVPSRGDADWVVLGARATLAYPLSPAWAVRGDLGAGLGLSRPEFQSAGAEQGLIHRPARYTGRGELGLELRF